MERYRSYGEKDDQPKDVGDGAFLGVDEYNAAENIKPGNVQKAINHDFTSQDANTRGGFVCLPELSSVSHPISTIDDASALIYTDDAVYGNGIYVSIRNITSPIGFEIYTGTNLNNKTLRTTISGVANGLKFTGKYFIIFGYKNNFSLPIPYVSEGVLLRSVDGITWETPSNLPNYTVASRYTGYIQAFDSCFIFWTGIFNVSSATDGVVKSTDNGTTWTQYTTGKTLYNLAYGNGVFVAFYLDAFTGVFRWTPYYSYDCIIWLDATWAQLGGSLAGSAQASIAFGNGTFLAAVSERISGLPGFSVVIYKSTNGITWERGCNVGVQESDALLLVPAKRHQIVYIKNAFLVWVANRSSATQAGRIFTTLYGDAVVERYSTSGIPYLAYCTYLNDALVLAPNPGPYNPGISLNAYSYSEFASVLGSGIYSDPVEKGQEWIMLAGPNQVGFYKFGRSRRLISLGKTRITSPATILQANNQVYIFRGVNNKPLYWNGDWNGVFTEVPNTTLPSSFSSIPNSNQATYYQNRLWVVDGKDSIAASDVLAFTDYDPQANEFNLNTGSSDYVVATFPFGVNTLIVFKNKSILALNNVEGSLLDVTATEITRQVGLVGPMAMTSIGPDLAYVSYSNINLLTLTATNNALQHKTLPLSSSIRQIMKRVNWEVGDKISIGYWSNKLYVALPLDNSKTCNAVVVYNFITNQWFGEWNFSPTINMCIQGWGVIDYLGLQRLYAITEDGRIFVTEEGHQDITGTNVAEISTEMITRAYSVNEGNHFQRRLYLDLATNRPKFSCASYTEGANEESVVITDQTYNRAETWKWADTPYLLTNANNDYNRPYRKDYATGPDSIQCGTGFEPEMPQEFRIPLLVRRQGRLSWLKITNTQGFISVMSLAFETRPGQRANFIQV